MSPQSAGRQACGQGIESEQETGLPSQEVLEIKTQQTACLES